MNKRAINLFILVFLLTSIMGQAQFNTLLPSVPKKEKSPLLEERIETKEEKYKTGENETAKKRKTWLNFTSKSELKQEIDSLKNMIKSYQKTQQQKEQYQKVRDSLILETQLKVQKRSEKPESPPVKIQIEERIEYIIFI